MGDKFNKTLQFFEDVIIECRNRAVNEHDREVALDERYWCMIKTVDCIMEFTNDRDKISDLLVKYFHMRKEKALHFLADYDIEILNRKNMNSQN